jgi:hypothetical protein
MKCRAFNPVSNSGGWKPCTGTAQGTHQLCHRHEDAIYGAILGLKANANREEMRREEMAAQQQLRLLSRAILPQPTSTTTGLPIFDAMEAVLRDEVRDQRRQVSEAIETLDRPPKDTTPGQKTTPQNTTQKPVPTIHHPHPHPNLRKPA